jgi:hypothetical protein
LFVPDEGESFNLIEAGSDLLGVLAAGITTATVCHDVSGLLAGPIGVGIAHTLRYGANSFVNRVLASRERARVGVVYGLAAHEIKRRLDNGESIRTDEFFKPDATGRSSADEITEAVLIAAQREYEERKLPLIAKLIAQILFDSSIDVGMAHQLLRFAETLATANTVFFN